MLEGTHIFVCREVEGWPNGYDTQKRVGGRQGVKSHFACVALDYAKQKTNGGGVGRGRTKIFNFGTRRFQVKISGSFSTSLCRTPCFGRTRPVLVEHNDEKRHGTEFRVPTCLLQARKKAKVVPSRSMRLLLVRR